MAIVSAAEVYMRGEILYNLKQIGKFYKETGRLPIKSNDETNQVYKLAVWMIGVRGRIVNKEYDADVVHYINKCIDYYELPKDIFVSRRPSDILTRTIECTDELRAHLEKNGTLPGRSKLGNHVCHVRKKHKNNEELKEYLKSAGLYDAFFNPVEYHKLRIDRKVKELADHYFAHGEKFPYTGDKISPVALVRYVSFLRNNNGYKDEVLNEHYLKCLEKYNLPKNTHVKRSRGAKKRVVKKA